MKFVFRTTLRVRNTLLGKDTKVKRTGCGTHSAVKWGALLGTHRETGRGEERSLRGGCLQPDSEAVEGTPLQMRRTLFQAERIA